jgi:integrase
MARPREGCVTWNKKRGAWIARLDWTDDAGHKQSRKRQVENKSAGNVLVKQWIRELEEQGAAYLDAERVTFKELAESYQETKLIAPIYRGGKKVAGKRDWERDRWRLERLIEYFGKRRIRSITYADIEAYRARLLETPTKLTKKERSIADVHRFLALLRAAFTYAVQKEWLIRNPFSKGEGLISMAQEVPRERMLSTEEQRKILQACQTKQRRHIYPIVLVALDSGCRRGELLGLKWRDVDLEKGAITVVAQNAKTNRKRVISLESITMAELRRLAKYSGGFPDELVFGVKASFEHGWHSAMEEAKVTGARFHDLRATAITTWLLRGMSVPFAMNRSGHADPRVFMRYVRMCEEIQQKQREQLREWDLASSLAELAGDNGAAAASDYEAAASELIN